MKGNLAVKQPPLARVPLAAQDTERETKRDCNLSGQLPSLPWGRPIPATRGDITSLGDEIKSIDYSQPAPCRESRSFNCIPVLCLSAAQGLGDVASAAKIAAGLKRAYPDKEICLILVEGLRPRPQLGPMIESLSDSGVVVQAMNSSDALEFTRRHVVAIQGVIPHTKDGGGRHFKDHMGAALNIYVPEYDPGFSYWNPTGMGLDRLCRDQSSCFHIATTSGFDGLGLFIGKEREISCSMTERQELLAALSIAPGSTLGKKVLASTWTMAYRNGCDLKRERLAHAIGNARKFGLCKEPITIFDFTPYRDGDIKDDEKHLTYRTRRDEATGIFVKPITFFDKHHDEKEVPNSRILRLGRQPNNLFQAAMRAAQLPVEITGDASLTEAILLGLPFFHDAPPWKWALQANLVRYCSDSLSLAAADAFRETFNHYTPHDSSKLEQCPALISLYLSHRAELEKIEMQYRASIGTPDSYEARSKQIRQLLIAKVPFDSVSRLELVWGAAAAEIKAGHIENELWALRRSFVLDCSYTSFEAADRDLSDARFVSTPTHWGAFRELQTSVRQNLDFTTNLRRLIEGIVSKHALNSGEKTPQT